MRTVLATLTLALGASIAPAQFGAPAPPPGGGFPAVPTTPAQSPYHTPYAGVRPVYPPAGLPAPGYGGVYVEGPVGGYFNGVANVVGAYGQYSKDYPQSRLL